MKDLIDELPGISLPVREMAQRLNTMWKGEGEDSPSEFRASQMNVVLHLGHEVGPEEASARFSDLIEFAQRYPSRIIVLCPCESINDGSMRAKLFSQCYIGDSHREMCCCEALMLGYQADNCDYLGNQVSVWLESDLPTYHWFNRLPASRIEAYFDNLLIGARRCVYDSSVDGTELADLEWPEPDRVGDLASARILPVRQAIGQYLSGYSIEQICSGLQAVRIRHQASMAGEGKRLLDWIKDCLEACEHCEDCSALKADFDLASCQSEDCRLSLEFVYRDNRSFSWKMMEGGDLAKVEATLGKSPEALTAQVKTLGAEQTIAEALLF